MDEFTCLGGLLKGIHKLEMDLSLLRVSALFLVFHHLDLSMLCSPLDSRFFPHRLSFRKFIEHRDWVFFALLAVRDKGVDLFAVEGRDLESLAS